jgi:hypothetical protein
MTVSNMEMGAGSRALSARPIFPTTDSTSGMASNAMFWYAITSSASPMEAWGMVVGIQRNEPSSSGGMNSRPSPGKACMARE